MRTYEITIRYSNKTELLEPPDGTPKRSLTTTWIRGNRGFFRIDFAVIGPQAEKPEGDFPLSRSEAQRIFEAITDMVIPLEEKLW